MATSQYIILLVNTILFNQISLFNPTNAMITVTSPTELNCNYGVTYTPSSDFYETYILDTCYILNTKMTYPPLDVSLKYTCDFFTNEISEKVWFNEICADFANHTNQIYLETHCNILKFGHQCNFLWLSSFDQHSHECKPHPHAIIKYAMILDTCILYEYDRSAFKNIYTQTENNRRQIIQFQYLSMSDCISDNMNTDNIDVTQSIADDIYDFIHQECNNGFYYTVQPPETFKNTFTQTDSIENISYINYNVTDIFMEMASISNSEMVETSSPIFSVYLSDKKNIFGGYDMLTVEFVIFVLFVSCILVVCCSVICWYVELRKCLGCDCFPRYIKVTNELMNDDEDVDDAVEIGDNMEFAALSEHRN